MMNQDTLWLMVSDSFHFWTTNESHYNEKKCGLAIGKRKKLPLKSDTVTYLFPFNGKLTNKPI